MENYDVENSALYRKLQSKVEALNIMRNELEKSRTERDQWKLMAETLQLRYSAIKNVQNTNTSVDYSGGSSVRALLTQTQQTNIHLQTEVDTLRQRLSELEGDMTLLRKRNRDLVAQNSKNEASKQNGSHDERLEEWNLEKSKLIAQLETLKKQIAQLKYDLKGVLDEKEEVVTERDAYKCKAHRLNYELNTALKNEGPEAKILDLDALILENKLLQERLKNVEAECDMAKNTAEKYKGIVETKRKKGIMKFTTNTPDLNSQVQRLIETSQSTNDSTIDDFKTESVTELKQICLTLLDNLNDKSLELSHQRKANKLLAAKIADLQQRLTGPNAEKSPASTFSPSQILLGGYSSAQVDLEHDEKQKFHKFNSDPITLSPAASSCFLRNSAASESTKSMASSSEYEKQSAMSDVSSEYTIDTVNETIASNEECNGEKLQELPKELQEMVQRAMSLE
ncbi:coiled-coil domain-containing protein 149 [Culicoides brevitarsis]|uniref:coiled-coil domain-containing protein 149 n=1 Tax=Culicoides brevitarsis TaxID=469753 RepID=UPI00307C7919